MILKEINTGRGVTGTTMMTIARDMNPLGEQEILSVPGFT